MTDDSLPDRLPEREVAGELWQTIPDNDVAARFHRLARQGRSGPRRQPEDASPEPFSILHSIGDFSPGPISLLDFPLAVFLAMPPTERIRCIAEVIAERTPAAEDRPHTQLAALTDLHLRLRPAVTRLEDDLAAEALKHGAHMADLAAAVGLTTQGATNRWGHLQGERVVVVISRRDRLRNTTTDDPRKTIGEVGGARQYDSDRMYWRIGADVRSQARHAVIAVDGVVRRVYEIDPDAWHQSTSAPQKWGFHAIGRAPLDPAVVGDLYTAGELPYTIGSLCPTRAGGAYRPERF